MKTAKEVFKEQLKNYGDQALNTIKYLGDGNITYDDIIESYDELNLPSPIKIIKNTWGQKYSHKDINYGWGNGYVRIPEGHKYYNKIYDDIDVKVHGGLTFSEHFEGSEIFSDGYWVGFDTVHLGDNLRNWSREKVFDETVKLFKQIYN